MIPIVIPVPTLHERTADEKEEMLVSFLKAEGRRMGVDVSISQNAFHCMLEFSYENNIDELKPALPAAVPELIWKNQRWYRYPQLSPSGIYALLLKTGG